MQATNTKLPTIVVLTTGGTIASRPDPSGGVVAAASGEELLEAVPGLKEISDVRVEELFRIGGYLSIKALSKPHLIRRVGFRSYVTDVC